MDETNFTTVFDITRSGFRDWTFPAFGLIFVAAGLGIFFWPRIAKRIDIPYLDIQSKFKKFFRYYFLGFAIFWTLTSFTSTYFPYRRHRMLAESGRCVRVEGPIESFKPMPYSGHSQETFSVEGVKFSYSDYEVSDSFNVTTSHGGPIREDSYVRICYDPSGNKILKLEIRNFTGVIKDESMIEALKPGTNTELRTFRIPWYSNFFVLLYLLDFAGLLTLYLPYLRTYFRIKTSAVQDFVLPTHLPRNTKIKLKNTLLFWDSDTHTIWIRPRGFNVLQVQLVIAKLTVDPSNTFIESQDVRFSSGMPVVFGLFLWSAYGMFSATIPATQMPVSTLQFVGLAAVMIALTLGINLKILSSRMEALVAAARDELKRSANE